MSHQSGGMPVKETELATECERPISGTCPICEAMQMWEVTASTGEYVILKGEKGTVSCPKTITYQECRDCGWRGRA